MTLRLSWLAPKAMIQAVVEMDKALAQARALGLDEEAAREEIRNEQIRTHSRILPFQWSEVRRQITLRAMYDTPTP